MIKKRILFHRPYINSKDYLRFAKIFKTQTINSRGDFTKSCEKKISKQLANRYCLLTSSCTHALEISALLLDLKDKDEIIVPSYTFVSTANAFELRGAKIVFADSEKNTPCIDPEDIKKKINKKTKAICIVHYAGFACNMTEILSIVKKYGVKLIEDCAHAIDAKYKNKYLGTFGDISTFSFHYTKNLISGEGGAIILKSKKYFNKAKIYLQKGTNRSDFLSKKTTKYTWVDIGSSYELSDLNACLLSSQLEKRDIIKNKRLRIFDFYLSKLKPIEKKGFFELPIIPRYSSYNGHIFYVLFKKKNEKIKFQSYMKKKNIILNSHYECLHLSPFYKKKYRKKIKIINAEKFASNILRFPIYPSLNSQELKYIINSTYKYFNIKNG